jgi:hypothetical protein
MLKSPISLRIIVSYSLIKPLARLLPLVALGLAGTARAQVVNIQTLLSAPIRRGLDLQMDLSQSQLRGNTDSESVIANISSTFRSKNHLFLVMLKRDYGTYEGQLSSDSFFAHVRYAFLFSKRWSWEFYGQEDADEFKRNSGRSIYGSGPRYQINLSDDFTFATSLAYIVESEKFLPYEEPGEPYVDPQTQEIMDRPSTLYFDKDRQTPRYSAMGFASYAFTESMGLSVTVEVQPALEDSANFKALYEGVIYFEYSDNVSFSFTYQHSHNSLPPYAVQKIDTSIDNSLSLNYHFSFGERSKRRAKEK